MSPFLWITGIPRSESKVCAFSLSLSSHSDTKTGAEQLFELSFSAPWSWLRRGPGLGSRACREKAPVCTLPPFFNSKSEAVQSLFTTVSLPVNRNMLPFCKIFQKALLFVSSSLKRKNGFYMERETKGQGHQTKRELRKKTALVAPSRYQPLDPVVIQSLW